ncbi:MAG: hypothetical protein AMJ90_03885 [candidate division Zixibacteria bacterium SM23_73_2]|nr:MAG: hypothetical protein AMJ90_03885 [candidate division Zixibacteria bacterium SM23_73_2]
MSAPFRIVRPHTGVKAVAVDEVRGGAAGVLGTQEDFKFYLDRLLKMIPAEVIGFYLVGSGFISQDDPIMLIIWTAVCLLGVVAVRAFGTADPEKHKSPDWVHIWISLAAFLIWIYTLGGFFKALNVHNPKYGSLMVLAFTFFVPLLYLGPKD